ncbi:unnamed protein product [Periconia digitata]|uniref:Uncharacterized protein n=1 Tax=Periconia digitata TaxID=1303443 RepID=A0A9W4XNU1_9PLEO|nr:unnamed protein product [Periconia digitata]
MTVLRVWRTTIAREAKEFVQALSTIVGWGVSDFKDAIIKELTFIETVLRERRME